MNKIIIDKKNYSLDIKEDAYLIIKNNCNLKVNILDSIRKKIIIYVKDSIVNINLELLCENNIIINTLGINSSINYDLNLKDNSSLYVVNSILAKKDSINNININHQGNNSKTIFYTNGINIDNNKLYFNINGIIKKGCLNCYLDENSKIINLNDGDSKIIPNLIIDSKEVIANHEAFIGTFSDNELFYLMSRGLTKDKAHKLLIKSLLLSHMEDSKEFIKEINDNINGGDLNE